MSSARYTLWSNFHWTTSRTIFLTGSTICRRSHDFFLSSSNFASGNAPELSGDKKTALDEAMLRAAPIPFPLTLECERLKARSRLPGSARILLVPRTTVSDRPTVVVHPPGKTYSSLVSYTFSSDIFHLLLLLNRLLRGPRWKYI